MKLSIVLAILLVFILGIGAIAQPPASIPQATPRIIVVVLDLTVSFHATAESVSKIKGVVRSLGPDDIFLLLTLGGAFSPAKDVSIQCIMPKMDPGLFLSARNIRDWHERQTRIEAVWAASARRQAELNMALEHVSGGLKETPLYELLSYVSHWFSSNPAPGTRILLIFSDLQHDYAGLRSPLPPKPKLPFEAVSVTAAFVPWGAGWDAREKAWREWFSPASFTMLDEASARLAVLVPPNPTPRQATKGF